MDVTMDWRGFREVNDALYDPDTVTVEEMVGILTEAHTYRGTADQP